MRWSNARSVNNKLLNLRVTTNVKKHFNEVILTLKMGRELERRNELYVMSYIVKNSFIEALM